MIYFLICWILEFWYFFYSFLFSNNVMFGSIVKFSIDDYLLPLGHVFASWLQVYYCDHSLFLLFYTLSLDISFLILNLNFEAPSCEFFWQSDIWYAYQRDSWQSSGCISLGFGVLSGCICAPPSPMTSTIGLVIFFDYYE